MIELVVTRETQGWSPAPGGLEAIKLIACFDGCKPSLIFRRPFPAVVVCSCRRNEGLATPTTGKLYDGLCK